MWNKARPAAVEAAETGHEAQRLLDTASSHLAVNHTTKTVHRRLYKPKQQNSK